MNKFNFNVAIILATFLSASVYAAAPVTDVTTKQSGQSVDEQFKELTRLSETRNRMQIRLQNQFDQLSMEMNQVNGNVELFNHKIEQIEERQRNLYQLLDEQNKPTIKSIQSEIVQPKTKNEEEAYQHGLNLVLVDKDYEQAIIVFKAFVSEYPKSGYVANAQYWLGQLLYKNEKRKEAKLAFLVVTEQFPNSSKRPDSLLKVGIIEEYLDEITSAKDFYKKLIKEYPGTSAAGLAGKRLKRL